MTFLEDAMARTLAGSGVNINCRISCWNYLESPLGGSHREHRTMHNDKFAAIQRAAIAMRAEWARRRRVS